MRKETKAMQSIKRIYTRLNLDSDQILAKTKLILSIYRDVVWAASDRSDDFVESSFETFGSDLGTALTYLNDFAPVERKQAFEAKVIGLFETRWLIDLVDMAMWRLHEYPLNGRLYCEILSKAYLTVLAYSETELLEALALERSTFFQRKKEAIMLLGIALWGHAIPKTMEITGLATDDTNLLSVGI